MSIRGMDQPYRRILTAQERELVGLFNSLTDIDRAAILEQVREWVKATKEGKRR